MCMMSIFGILAKTIENEPLEKWKLSDLRHLVYPGNKPRLAGRPHPAPRNAADFRHQRCEFANQSE